jgi:hypothetical protein
VTSNVQKNEKKWGLYLVEPWTLNNPPLMSPCHETLTFMVLSNLCPLSSKAISIYHFYLLLVVVLEMVKTVAQKCFSHVASIGVHKA